MRISDVQMLLAAAGVYAGNIDNDAGPKTMAAVREIEKAQAGLYPSSPAKWAKSRRLIAAAQVILHAKGLEPGAIDGYAGHNTDGALADWKTREATGEPMKVNRSRALTGQVDQSPATMDWPTQRQVPSVFGPAGNPRCTAGKCELAFPMRIAWNKRQTIRSFSCHELVAEPLTAIFADALEQFGYERIVELELDIFGGCFNNRSMRGGASKSMHAYGIAVDLNPEKNQLHWGADRAQFARPEYRDFWDIVTAHGATPAGYAWGKDWMHFQFARLR